MRVALSILAILLLPLAARASTGDDACGSNGTPALGVIDTGVGIYVDDRNYLLGNGIWVYEESNEIAGLQRGDTPDWGTDQGDPCVDDPNVPPDTLVF